MPRSGFSSGVWRVGLVCAGSLGEWWVLRGGIDWLHSFGRGGGLWQKGRGRECMESFEWYSREVCENIACAF